jgi:hypothetical protein
LQRRRQERIGRVAEARAEGQSLRAIAEAEEISVAQVNRDLESASTVPGGTVKPTDGKVTGMDGRQQPATKPKPAPVATTDNPPEPDDLICDDEGNPVPAKLRAVFAECYLFNSAVARLAKAAEALVRIEESPFYQTEGAKKYSTSCRTAEKRMIGLRPAKVCCGSGCEKCESKGYLTTAEVDDAPVD